MAGQFSAGWHRPLWLTVGPEFTHKCELPSRDLGPQGAMACVDATLHDCLLIHLTVSSSREEGTILVLFSILCFISLCPFKDVNVLIHQWEYAYYSSTTLILILHLCFKLWLFHNQLKLLVVHLYSHGYMHVQKVTVPGYNTLWLTSFTFCLKTDRLSTVTDVSFRTVWGCNLCLFSLYIIHLFKHNQLTVVWSPVQNPKIWNSLWYKTKTSWTYSHERKWNKPLQRLLLNFLALKKSLFTVMLPADCSWRGKVLHDIIEYTWTIIRYCQIMRYLLS